VYVEAESNKIGSLTLPSALINAMHHGACLLLETSLDERVAGLLEDYRHYLDNPTLLIAHLQVLYRFQGAKKLEQWIDLIQRGEHSALVKDLLVLHYDPSYTRATAQHFVQLERSLRMPLQHLTEHELNKIADEL
jgi:tRNA 2-selenouridine synthase